jgi:hypothetical protein
MCLYIKDIQKQVATEPLKVYKLLDINDMPPYYPSDAYHIGINKPETQTYTATAGEHWAGPGYLHAYTDKAKAILSAKNIWGGYASALGTGTVKYKIVEMYIPKGSAYYWNQVIGATAAEALEWRPDSPVEIGEVEYINEDLPF